MAGYHSGGGSIMPSLERPQQAERRPSLLPAFEPLSSSPGGLPRVLKRKFDHHHHEDDHDHQTHAAAQEDKLQRKYYPTPVPTSSTGMLLSSPDSHPTRPTLQRAVSALSERAPLSAVPSVSLPSNGNPLLMGRSSNSSDYQLSANRLISRVHVRATYKAPEGSRLMGEVLVECLGWNGAKIHYQGSVVELAKGETFLSQKPGTQIMVDVQETRILLAWPKSSPTEADTWEWTEDALDRDSTGVADGIASSPPAMMSRLRSPVSPSPNNRSIIDASFDSTFLIEDNDEADVPVQVYEDGTTPDDELPGMWTPVPVSRASPEESRSSTPSRTPKAIHSSIDIEAGELSEHDEENDPIVHSFGPFGDNLLTRFESFSSTSPDRPRDPLKSSLNSNASPRLANEVTPVPTKESVPVKNMFDNSPVRNHIINQLAFSRVHSIPLSTIYNNLPSEMKKGKRSDPETWSTDELKDMMYKVPCVGEIRRQGNDAAGKALEDEFYYVPELDTDEHRRAAVSIAKPPLRATRKQHKQYYWKKPRH